MVKSRDSDRLTGPKKTVNKILSVNPPKWSWLEITIFFESSLDYLIHKVF